MPTYFISGHLDLTPDEFDDHYRLRLREAVSKDASFVVGDAHGTDRMAQVYLMGWGANVTVFHMLVEPRNNAGFPTEGGFRSDAARDAQMTADSDADIAWVRPGREKSGTARNLKRRTEK